MMAETRYIKLCVLEFWPVPISIYPYWYTLVYKTCWDFLSSVVVMFWAEGRLEAGHFEGRWVYSVTTHAHNDQEIASMSVSFGND